MTLFWYNLGIKTKDKKIHSRWLVVLIVVFSLVAVSSALIFFRKSNDPINNSLQRLKLINVKNEPLPGVDVEIYSDNGVRCALAPCPEAEVNSWEGKTDASGYIFVPSKYIRPSLLNVSIRAIKYIDEYGQAKYRMESDGENPGRNNFEVIMYSQ